MTPDMDRKQNQPVGGWGSIMMVSVLLSGAMPSANAGSNSTHYSITSTQIGGGGATVSSSSYSIQNSIGGISSNVESSSASYAVQSGFTSQLNQAPSIQSRTINLLEDTPVTFTLEASDPENDPLTYTIVQQPVHGTLTGTAPTLTYQPDAGFADLDILKIKASDGQDDSAVAVITFNVGEVNDPPVATAQTVSLAEDGSKNLTLTGTDPENDPLTFQITQGPSHGSLTGQAPNVLYQPAADFNGSDSFQFKVSDGFLESDTVVVSITVTPVNDTPGAQAQNVSTSEDTVLNITLTGVDVDGDTLSFQVTRQPAHGVLSGQAPALVYQPNANYNGPDSFDFKVSDGLLSSQDATITFNVTSVNDAPTIQSRSFNLQEDQSIPFTLETADADGDALTYTFVSSPSNGSITGTAPNLTYQPNAGYSGTDTLQVKVSDGQLESAVANIQFNVGQVNDAPVATAQSVAVVEDTPKGITLSATDDDGDPLTYQVTVNPTHGTLTGQAPNLTYQPNADYHGPDSFSFKASDGILDSADATVTVTISAVNDQPEATPQAVTVSEDGSQAIQLGGTDVDGDAVSFQVTVQPSHGSLTGQAPALSYQPDANYHGPDSFQFTVSDGTLDSDAATISLNVTPLNDAPVAQAQSVNVSEDVSKVITLTGTDIDGDTLSYQVVQSPGHGSLTGQAPSLTYQPAADYHGADSISFKVSDGVLDSAVVIVTITVDAVNDAPVANAQTLTLAEDTSLAVTLSGSDVDGDPLTYRVSTQPTHGTLTGQASTFTYQPDLNYEGPDSFGFVVNDGTLDSAEAIVSLTVTPVNDAPIAQAQSLVLPEDSLKAIVLTGNDPDGDALTFQVTQLPAHGNLTGTAPNLEYQPAVDFIGKDNFSFKVSDGVLESSPVVVSLEINPVNDPPTIQSRTVNLSQDQAVNFALEASDPEQDPLTYIIVVQPAHGTLTGTAPNLNYQPDQGYVGVDTLSVKVSDGQSESGLGVITFNVGEVNDAPTAQPQTLTLAEDATKGIVLTATDPENDPLTFQVTQHPIHGTLSGVVPNVTYHPNPNFNGQDSLQFKASDGFLQSAAATIVLNITSVNDAPVAQGQTVNLAEDTSKPIALSGTDIDGDVLTFAVIQQPGHGTLTGQPPNLTYQPDTDYHGPDSFTFKASDASSSSADAVVSLNVSPQNDAPTATDQSIHLDEDSSKVMTFTGSDIDGDALTFQIETGPSHGSLAGQPPTVTYIPAANYTGPDSFTFKASDGALLSPAATVTLTVNAINDAPTAQSRTVNLAQGQSVNFILEGSDVENDPLSFLLVQGVAHGTITGTAPNLSYQSDANYAGLDSYQFKVSDGQLQSSVGTITFNVGEVNDPPVGQTQSATIPEDSQVLIILGATDPESDPLTYQIVTQPTHGTVTGQPPAVTYTPSPNYHGADSFSFKASDGFLESGDTVISITVTSVNDAPVSTAQSLTLPEDSPKPITLTGSDLDGDAVSFVIVQQPQHGSLSGQAPALTYQPNLNFVGVDSFSYKVSDGTLDSGEALISLNVTPLNDPPTALAQAVTLPEDGSKQITLSGNDPDADPLSFLVTQQPTHGTLSGQPPVLTYTPAVNYFGPDNFSFSASDGQVDSGNAIVSIDVTALNDAPTIQSRSVNLAQDQSTGFVLDASDVEGDALVYIFVLLPANGTLSGTAPNLTYQPNAGFVGADTLQVKVSDGQAESGVAFITFDVGEVNDAPSANGQTIQLTEDTSKIVILAATDPENDPLTYLVTKNPLHGNLSGQAPTLTYQPNLNYNGPDSFSFKASDGALESNEAIILLDVVSVNDAPLAHGQAVNLAEDIAKPIALTGSDVDGDPLTFVIINPPVQGALTGQPPNVSYQPASNFHGPDSFTFKVSDGTLSSADATVTLSISPQNDAPTAIAQSLNLDEDSSKAITLAGSDIDGDSLTFQIETGPSHGSLTGQPPLVTYTPVPNYNGPDSFTFTASDGALLSPDATVTLSVNAINDAPTVQSRTVNVAQGQLVNFTLESDDLENDSLTYQLVQGVTHGTITGTAPNLTYQADANYTGLDSYQFKVSDGLLLSAVGTIEFNVGEVNDPPVGQTQSATIPEDSQVLIILGATDPDGDPLTYQIVTQPSHGTLTGQPPTMTYTPSPNYHGADSFSFKASDGFLESGDTLVSITVTSVNDAPVSSIQSVTLPEDAPTPITLAGSDPDGDAITFTIVQQPQHGSLSGQAPALTYQPNLNYVGPDSFSYTVSDGALDSVEALISLNVTPLNDAPTALAQTLNLPEDGSLQIHLSGTDPDADPLTFQVTQQPLHGTLNGQPPVLTYQPNADYNGADSFVFKASDGQLESGNAIISLDITAVNDAPTVQSRSVNLLQDQAAPFTLEASDLDGDSLTFIYVLLPANGTLSGTAPNLTFQPNAGFVGTDTLQVKVSDGSADSNVAFITFNVGEVNDAPIASAQTIQLNEDTSTGIVLTATDPENDPLTYLVTQNPAHGLLSGQAPTLSYQPKSNFHGADSFKFKASDGALESDEVLVNIEVISVNDTPVAIIQSVSLNEDGSQAIILAGSDADGDPLTFRLTQDPGRGSLSGNAPNVTYQPEAQFYGQDGFTFVVSDGTVDSSPALVTIEVVPVNDPPTVVSQSLKLSEDTPKTITLTGADVDGDPLTFEVTVHPTHGTLTGNIPSLTYQPDANFHGADTFQFKASDGALDSTAGVVVLEVDPVNDVPDATAFLVSLNEDVATPVDLIASDPDGDVLTYEVVTQPVHGSLVGQAPNMTFIPEADYFGTDTFTFKVSDGQAESEVKTISLAIAAVNDAPVIQARTIHLLEDQSVDFTIESSDVENDPLTYQIVSSPTNGSLSGTAPNLTYQSNPSFFGTDTFQVKASDGQVDSEVQTISFNIGEVNDPPVAQRQSVTISEDTNVVLILGADDPEQDPLTFRIASNPVNGTLSGQPPAVTYQPNANFNGADSFTFRASDGFLESEETTISINVTAINDAPSASQGSVTVAEDGSEAITLVGSDIDGDTLSFRILQIPSHGSLTGTSPTFTYQPEANYHGEDSFTFVASDGVLDSSSASVTIQVTPVNDPPTATSQTIVLEEDTPKGITLSGVDLDGDTLTFLVTQGPLHGSLTGQPPSLTYTPEANYHGADIFTFKVSDGNLDSEEAEISLDVSSKNDAPTAQDVALQTYFLDEVRIPELGNDPDGDTVSVVVVSGPSQGQVVDRSGELYYVNTSLDASKDQFTFRLTDGELFSETQTVTVELVKSQVTLDLNPLVITENQGKAQLKLTRTTHLNQSLEFELSAAPGSRVKVPATVSIPAGAETASVEVEAVDNTLASGDKTVQLIARHGAFNNDPVTLNIRDDEVMTLSLAASTVNLSENGGESQITASVNTPPLDEPITLSLSATPGNQVILPSMLVIPAGANKATFIVKGNDNSRSDGDRTVNLAVRNLPTLSASLELAVLDDDVSHKGRLTDGWIAGATVFFDANKNRQLDAGEPSTTTNDVGQFFLNLPPSEFDLNKDGVVDAKDGTLVGLGGTDITTGLSQTSVMLSSPSASVISPLTTLVVTVLETTPQLSESEAVSQVQSALSIDESSNILHFDAYQEAEQGNPAAVSVIEATAKVQDTVVQVETFLGAAANNGQANLGQSVQQSLAKRISQGQGVDLENANWVADLIDESARDNQVNLNLDARQAAAQIVSVSNQQKKLVAGSGFNASKAAEEIVRIQAYSQSVGTADLADLGRSTQDAEELRIKYGDQNFQGLVQTTAIGALNAIDIRPGQFSFNLSNYQIQEDGKILSNVVITRTNGSFGTVDLLVQKMAVTARSDVDFVTAPISVHFDSLEVNKTVPLNGLVIDDKVTEPLETMLFILDFPEDDQTGAVLGEQSTAVLEIADNDAVGKFQFSKSTVTVRESQTDLADIYVERSGGSTGEVTLILERLSGSAIKGSDYVALSDEIVFPEGILRRKLPLVLINDDIRESDESLILRLQLKPNQNDGASLGHNNQLSVRIQNDDLGPAPIIQVPEDQIVQEDSIIGPLGINISDEDTPAAQLNVVAVSSNPLITNENLNLENVSGTDLWLLTATPTLNGFGDVEVTILVSDGLQSVSESFNIRIVSQNDPPNIQGLSELIVVTPETNVFLFEVDDPETGVDDLAIYYSAERDGTDFNRFFDLQRDENEVRLTVDRKAQDHGSIWLKLGAIDADGGVSEKQFLVEFRDTDLTPIIQLEVLGDGQVVLTWEGDFELLETSDLNQPFQLVEGAFSPHVVELQDKAFYRLK